MLTWSGMSFLASKKHYLEIPPTITLLKLQQLWKKSPRPPKSQIPSWLPTPLSNRWSSICIKLCIQFSFSFLKVMDRMEEDAVDNMEVVVKHYCWTHGMCSHKGYHCRTPAEGHKFTAIKYNHIVFSGRNIPNTSKSGPVHMTHNINIADNITLFLTVIQSISTVVPLHGTSIIAKADIGTTNNYWINQD